MRKIGFKPFVVGLCVAGILALVSLSLILFVGWGSVGQVGNLLLLPASLHEPKIYDHRWCSLRC